MHHSGIVFWFEQKWINRIRSSWKNVSPQNTVNACIKALLHLSFDSCLLASMQQVLCISLTPSPSIYMHVFYWKHFDHCSTRWRQCRGGRGLHKKYRQKQQEIHKICTTTNSNSRKLIFSVANNNCGRNCWRGGCVFCFYYCLYTHTKNEKWIKQTHTHTAGRYT